MKSYHHHSLWMIVLVTSWVLQANAQVPVVEAGAGQIPSSVNNSPVQNSGNTAGNYTGNTDIVEILYLQLEALQAEVQSLRGVVEEQSYQIRRMQTEQRDRYLDLDRRLNGIASSASTYTSTSASETALVNNSATPSPLILATETAIDPQASPVIIGNSQQSPVTITGVGDPVTDTVSIPLLTTVLNEEELYRSALNLLLEESEYEQSIALFQQYIDVYPTGRRLTNAYYWQGEAFILVSRYNQAQDVFMKILDDYPADPKAAGALLKLGVAYSQMGNIARARQVWEDLSIRYPDSPTENRTARDFLRAL